MSSHRTVELSLGKRSSPTKATIKGHAKVRYQLGEEGWGADMGGMLPDMEGQERTSLEKVCLQLGPLCDDERTNNPERQWGWELKRGTDLEEI